MAKNNKPPQNLHLIASLSCGLSIVVSLIYIALCSVGIYYRSNCDAGFPESFLESDIFMRLLHALYFKQRSCENMTLITDVIDVIDITQESTVFLMTILILVFSIFCLISAVSFITVLNLENAAKSIEICGYIYVAVCVLSLAADLVAAVHFGMDYSTFKSLMNNPPDELIDLNYSWDTLRLGAFFLMTVSVKAYVAPVINTIFLVLLVVYLAGLRKTVQNEQHSIHKAGVLNGYDQPKRFDEQQSEHSYQHFRQQPKRNEDPWQHSSENIFPYKGPQLNPVYINDEESPRILNRDISRTESSNPTFDRSYSWHRNQPSGASRPFSYLEDTKSRAPPPKAPSPVRDPQWTRDPWQSQTPPVPAPDYSPETPRRLKSALKASYM